MNHWNTVKEALEKAELDAVLLTGKSNRFYASGFDADEEGGVALVSRKGNFFFTDSRYLEAAESQIEDAAIGCIDRDHSYMDWINEALELSGSKIVGFEEQQMTVADFRAYEKGLHCTLQEASSLLQALRQTKDAEELRRMEKAQEIAETAFSQLLRELLYQGKY